MKLHRFDYWAVASYLVAGIAFYAIAVYSTFGHALWQRSTLGATFGPVVMIVSISLAGLAAIALAYLMVLYLGGYLSLPLADSLPTSHTLSRSFRSRTRRPKRP